MDECDHIRDKTVIDEAEKTRNDPPKPPSEAQLEAERERHRVKPLITDPYICQRCRRVYLYLDLMGDPECECGSHSWYPVLLSDQLERALQRAKTESPEEAHRRATRLSQPYDQAHQALSLGRVRGMKRYRLYNGVMHESPKGKYVKYEDVKDLAYTKEDVKRLANQCNCHFHVPDPSPCPLHDL